MLKHLPLLAAASILAAACASQPAATGGAPASGAAVSLTPGVANVLNIAATSAWNAEERLLPQQPILALVNGTASVNDPSGFSMTCNPDTGKVVARLGKQLASRVGQQATYKLKLGKDTRSIEGKFEANAKTPGEADFVFPIDAISLRTMAQLDQVAIDTDQGESQWAFVRDPASPAKAKYVGSLKNLNAESSSFLVYCNPK